MISHYRVLPGELGTYPWQDLIKLADQNRICKAADEQAGFSQNNYLTIVGLVLSNL